MCAKNLVYASLLLPVLLFMAFFLPLLLYILPLLLYFSLACLFTKDNPSLPAARRSIRDFSSPRSPPA
jgi:hypothetical protein